MKITLLFWTLVTVALAITVLFLTLATVALADRETKLVSALEKALRGVEKANKKSEDAGAAATAYCKSKGMTFGVKSNGLMGCMKPAVSAPAK